MSISELQDQSGIPGLETDIPPLQYSQDSLEVK